jgi:hypothetical protein
MLVTTSLQFDQFAFSDPQVKLGVQFFVLSGLFASAILSEEIEATERLFEISEENSNVNSNKNDEHKNETSVNSTKGNAAAYKENWPSAPQPGDIHRITTPVIITSPHADLQRNLSAIPIPDAIYSSQHSHLSEEDYVKALQKHHYPSKGDEEGQRKHQYSQPLPPDLFLAQKYIHVQQQKDQEGSIKQNFPKPVLPEAKHRGYSFNSESISYKPLKFDADPSTLFTSGKGGPSLEKGSGYDNKEMSFKQKIPNTMQGNTYPYPYQNPHSSRDSEIESSTTSSNAVFAKGHQGGSWVDGYKTGITYQER